MADAYRKRMPGRQLKAAGHKVYNPLLFSQVKMKAVAS
jgi:hypothetical protein